MQVHHRPSKPTVTAAQQLQDYAVFYTAGEGTWRCCGCGATFADLFFLELQGDDDFGSTFVF